MASVDDVAAAVLEEVGTVDTWKLQKLVYYCQAWHLVWDGEPLFAARIEAWANGPVVPKLYRKHRQAYRVRLWPSGDPGRLTESERETVRAVCDFYGGISGYELSQLTHQEAPWLDARHAAGLGPGQRGNVEVPLGAMLDYYGGLVAADAQ